MSASVPPKGIRHALVLGGGGLVGIAWMAGLAVALREAGIDLALADRIVGTSAGSVIGAVLAAGGDLNRPVNPPGQIAPPQFNEARFGEIMGMLVGSPGLDPAEVRRRAGARALEMAVGDPNDHIARMHNLTGVSDWPNRDLVITTIDATTGEPRFWTRADSAPLPTIVAASTSVPGIFPPIPIDGHHYFDGGFRSPINADLAAGADLILIIEPLAHVFPHGPHDDELGPGTTISIVPDAETIAAFGVGFFDLAAKQPAYEAGIRQATAAAAILKDVWPTSR